jgi:hypothetical protein
MVPGHELWHLVRLEFTRAIRLYLRYPLEAVLGVGFLTLLFLAVALGVGVVANPVAPGFDSRPDGLLIGFLCWAVVVGGTANLGAEIEDEARTGVLEPLFLSRYSIVTIMVARSLSSLLAGLPVVLLLAVTVAITSGQTGALQPKALPLLILLDVGATGVGLAVAAVAVAFKRIRTLLIALQLIVIYALVFPLAPASMAALTLPVIPAVHAIREVISSAAFTPPVEFCLIALNAVFYFAAGTAILFATVHFVKSQGRLSHY